MCWSFSVIFVSRTKTEEDPRTAGSCKVEGNWAHLGKQRDARGKCQPRLRDRFRRRRIERSSRVNEREENTGCGGGMHVWGVGLAQMTEMWKLLKVRFYIVHVKLIRCLVLGTLKIEWFTRKVHQSVLFRPFCWRFAFRVTLKQGHDNDCGLATTCCCCMLGTGRRMPPEVH